MSEPTGTTSAKAALEGSVPSLATPAERAAAMDEAFDYRGDVTIHTASGQVIEGYVFDRRSDVPEPYVRVLPRDPGHGEQRVKVPYSQITRLVFSGRDTAAGKSWETWVKKYHEKKAAGEKAFIEADRLE